MTISAQLSLRPARRTWDDLAAMVELAARPAGNAVALSAETGRLAVTPAPYGKPNGPGLYGVAGNAHSPYFEQLVKALMEKRGMDKGRASAIAWGVLRKWSRGGGDVHPEVRAAATGALALEKVAQARAHAHARTWDDVGALIDLAWIANPTAAQYAVIDARTGHSWWKDGAAKAPAKVTASALVTHHDGTVTGGAGKVKVGSLAHENGKWVAHHGDGTTTKHVSKPVALKAMAAHHNARPAQPAPRPASAPPAPSAPRPAAARPAPAAVPAVPAVPAASPAPAPAAAAAKAPAKISAAGLVTHQDGTVAHKQTGAQVATLTHENGKWAAHHADGTVTKHANKAAALQAVVAHHNKAGAAQQPPAPKPAAKPAAAPAAKAPAARPEPAAKAAEPQAEGPISENDKYRLTGLWSTSYRYSNKNFGAGKQGTEFAGELHRLLATNKPPDVCEAGCQDAHKFLAMVDRDATVQHSEMQRGISLGTEDAKRMFQPGKPVDLPAASWTTKKSIATGFAKGEAGAGKMKVILHTAPPAKGLDISGRSNFPMEQEVVTGGRYNVGKVTTTGGVMHVYVTQQDFSAN